MDQKDTNLTIFFSFVLIETNIMSQDLPEGDGLYVNLDVTGNFTTQNITATTTNLVPQYATPTAGQTVTSNGSSLLILNPAATLATLTVVFPSAPKNGQYLTLFSTHIVTALTVTSVKSLYNGPSALAANAKHEFVFSASLNQWIMTL
jgi:hypothetical protein